MSSKESIKKILSGEAVFELITPAYWDGKFSSPGKKNFKISLCTTAMGRLEDVKKTLPQNIEDNIHCHLNTEFVLLDYNSRDGLGDWVKSSLGHYIKAGVLSYYRTDEPKYYTMAHSRNMAFKLATGDIVNNVDADSFTRKGFAKYINSLANEVPEKCVFAKGRRMLRGRLGFYRKEFIELLGGYDEQFSGYGHDDHDILHRAWALGFKMAWFGGKYYGKTDSKKHQTSNYKNKDWKETECRNKVQSFMSIMWGRFKANSNIEWGKGRVIKNFSEEIIL